MFFAALASVVVILHLAFVAFVLLGGLWAARRPAVAWLHLPAAGWGALVEFAGWICPLTVLENLLWVLAGRAGYRGGFVEHYLLPVLYPAGLTRGLQVGLGVGVLALNLWVYGRLWLSRGGRSRSRGSAPAG